MTKDELTAENERLRKALREIIETGSRNVFSTYGNEDGTYTKTLIRVDRSIEAEMAHDALHQGPLE
jgi:hypothetical protein